jgi:predicted ATPase
MLQIKINQNYKSIKAQDAFELPKFCVLTGKNGSGKSHLLEAIAKVDISTVVQDGARQQRLKYIPFGGLTPQVKSDCSHLQLIKDRKNAWNNLNQHQCKRESYKYT